MEETEKVLSDEDLNPKEYKMSHGKLSKLVLINSLPTIAGMIINALYNLVDRFWVAKIPGEGIGENALAAVSLCNAVLLIIFAFAQLIGIGSAACISISLGKRDKKGAEQILGNTFTLSIVFSLILTALGFIFKEQLLTWIGTSENTRAFADEFLTVMLLGTIFNMLSFTMNHPIRAAGNSMMFAVTQFLGAILNIILDPILIIKLDMGVRGAAIATIFSMFCSTMWVMYCYKTGISGINLKKKYFKLHTETIKRISSIGFSSFFMQLAASVITLLINRLLMYYGNIEYGNGDIAVAAMSIAIGINQFILMPLFGINQGTQPIIGYNYGAKNYERVRDSYKWSVVYCVAISIIGLIVAEFFAEELVMSFNTNPDLVKIGAHGIRVIFSPMIIVGFGVPTINLFTAINRASVSLVLSLLRQLILLLPLYYILPRFFGFDGIWYAVPIAETFTFIIMIFVVIREFKLLKNKLGYEKNLEVTT